MSRVPAAESAARVPTTAASRFYSIVDGWGFWLPVSGLPRVRWFYFVFAAASSLSCVGPIVGNVDRGAGWRLLALVALLLVLLVRVTEFRRGRLLPVWTEFPQAAAVAVAATVAGPLGAGIGLFFTGCFFRAVYGSSRRTVVVTLGAVGLLWACAASTAHAGWHDDFVGQAVGIVASTLLTRLLFVTLRRQNEEVLANQRLLTSVFDSLDVSVMVDPGLGVPAVMNRAARQLSRELGLPDPPLTWSGTTAMYAADGTTRLSPDQLPAARALTGEHVREMELVVGNAGDARRRFSVNAAPVVDLDTSAGVVVTLHEVTSQHRAQAELLYLASYDTLTGLGNRNMLSQAITDFLLHRPGDLHRSAVILLGLDGFKHINDGLGYAFGDEVLQVVAARVRQCVRPSDIVARLGGDEFAVLVTGGAAVDVAQRICDIVREPIDLPRSRVVVSASVGVVQLESSHTTEAVFAAADLAMYAAKAAGRNQVTIYHPDMHQALEHRRTLEEDLRQALRDGEFELHYQAYLNLETGDCPGAEALVRWRHPVRGLIPPQQFIPVTEDNGMIIELGRWILRTACSAAAGWQPADPGQIFSISVNVSARQLDDARLVDDVAMALAESGLPAAALTIEITESALVEDSPVLIERLHTLKMLGVQIAVDDFGTGYSSLSRLGTFPVDTLKIDISFVAEVETTTGAALVSAIIALAAALDLNVVGEGVETLGQARALKARGCRVVQGYYFARPVPAPLSGPPVLLRAPAQPDASRSGTDQMTGTDT